MTDASKTTDTGSWRHNSSVRLVDYWEKYLLRYSEYYRSVGVSNPLPDGDPWEYVQSFPITHKKDFAGSEDAFLLKAKGPGAPKDWALADVESAGVTTRLTGSLRVDVEDPEEAFRHEWLPIHFQRSGGTTGQALTTSYTQYDIFGPFRDSAEYLYRVTGVLPTDRVMNLCPAAPHLGIYATLILPLLIGQPNFNTFGGRVLPTGDQLLIADQFRPNAIIGITSYVGHWLRMLGTAVQSGQLAGLSSLRRVICVGEPVGTALRARLRDLANAGGARDIAVLEGMSSTEMRSAGFYECAEGSGMHVDDARFFVELLNPETRAAAEPGEPGILVWSHIGWRGHALARYWTGDYVARGLTLGECPSCGRYGQRLLGPISRYERDFTKVRGAIVEYTSLVEALQSVPQILNFQVILNKATPSDPASRDEMEILVGSEPNAVKREEVVSAVRRASEITPDRVRFLGPDDVERKLFARKLKAELIIDDRK